MGKALEETFLKETFTIKKFAEFLLVPGSFYGFVREQDIIKNRGPYYTKLNYILASIGDSSKAIVYYELYKLLF